jgi:hypothetical protein
VSDRVVSPSEYRAMARDEMRRQRWSHAQMRAWLRRRWGPHLGALDPWRVRLPVVHCSECGIDWDGLLTATPAPPIP